MASPDTFDYNRTVLPFTSSTSSGLGNLPAPIQRAYLSDPSVLMAQRMAQQGADTSPVSSPLLGLVRALQGGLAGYSLGAAEKRYGERGRNYSDALTQALSAPNYVDALRQAAATNPDLQGALVEALQAQLANKQKLEQKRGEYDLQLEYDPKVAGAKAAAENPALAERYKSNKATDLLYDPAIAAAKVNAENPGLIARHGAFNASDAQWAAEKAAQTARGQGVAASEPVVFNGQSMPRGQAQSAMSAAGQAQGQLMGQVAPVNLPPVGPGQTTARDLAQAQKTPEIENQLRDEFVNQTKDQRIVFDSYNKIKAASQSKNGAGDMAMLYAYMKLLDPGSVVRESEFEMAAKTGSLPQQIQGFADKILTGGKLPDAIRDNFLREADNLYAAQMKAFNQHVENYTDLATRNKANPQNVVVGVGNRPGDMPQPRPQTPPPGTVIDYVIGPNGQLVPKQ